MGSDASSAFQCLCEDLGGQTGRATQDHRDEVSRYVAAVIRKKARHNGLQLDEGDVEELVAKVNLRISQDFKSYNPEYSFKSWITNHIVSSVVSQEKKRRDREDRILPRFQPVETGDEQNERKSNEIWDMDLHKFQDTHNTVEREVVAKMSEDHIWQLCADKVSDNQLHVAIGRLQRNMSSAEIGMELGKTEKQVNDLFYQFRKTMMPVLKELGYSVSS